MTERTNHNRRNRDRKTFPRQGKYNRVDTVSQGATPEVLRIEIDQIFKQFMDDPDQNEYIFRNDLNRLQRKYIHNKAATLNIISRSYGKEPHRHLHLRKKCSNTSLQSFNIIPSDCSRDLLSGFIKKNAIGNTDIEEPYRSKKREEFSRCKLLDQAPVVPNAADITKEIYDVRTSLPIIDHRNIVIHAIRENQIVVISSETGSGKTTQVPQYILEDNMNLKLPCKIVCTQPRRISAIAAAERVSFERNEKLGTSVGYIIRLEQLYNAKTNLIYCTTGIFLRSLMTSTGNLKNITHIIIDEVHERDKLSDFLLICLKQTLKCYPHLKIILMSATVNASKFVEYFGTGEILSIPGRLHPITTLFLDQVLHMTNYMSPKMKRVEKDEQQQNFSSILDEQPPRIEYEPIEDCTWMDEALDEYMNYPNYDHNLYFEEATAQLLVYFIAENVNPNYRHSRTGKTALMIAASLKDKMFIERLVRLGASMDIRCNENKTVYDYAIDYPDVHEFLCSIQSEMDTTKRDQEVSDEATKLLRYYDKTTNDEIDFELIVAVVCFIMYQYDDDGAILIFLPGYDDIMICNDYITSAIMETDKYDVFFLHGSMNIKDQHRVFKKLPNKRKIILSTNIAETSITIDDVAYVIDTGKAKEKSYDSYNKVSSLQTHWIAKACAKQRMGRAGRTRPGMCFRLYSYQRYQSMAPERIPEMLRVSLEELCLHAKVLATENMNILNFLSMAPDPPSHNAVKVAIENLQFLGALDHIEDLTVLGEYLSRLAIEPRLGKMLIYSIIFKCLDPVLTLTASLTHKDPFELPPQANLKTKAASKRRELTDGTMSDHILYLEVYNKWQDAKFSGRGAQFCRDYFISENTMCTIMETRNHLLGQLKLIGFLPDTNNYDDFNIHATSWPLIKAVICTGSYPNVAFMTGSYLSTRTDKKVNIPKNSACYNKPISTWLMFDELFKRITVLLLRGVTAVTTISIALICGNEIMINPNASTLLTIDDWLEFDFCTNNDFIILRTNLDKLVVKVLSHPQYLFNNNDYLVINTLRGILDAEDEAAGLTVLNNVGQKPRFSYRSKDTQRGKNSNKKTNWRSNQNWRSENPNQNYSKPRRGGFRDRYRQGPSHMENWRQPGNDNVLIDAVKHMDI